MRFVYSCLTTYPQIDHLKKNGEKDSFEVIKWVLQLNRKTDIVFHVAIRTPCPHTLFQVLLWSVLRGDHTTYLPYMPVLGERSCPLDMPLITDHRGDQVAKVE